MRRSTPSALTLLLAASLAACSSAAPIPVGHAVGVFGPLEPIILDNLSLPDGRYELNVELEVFFRVQGLVEMSCAIVDTTGSLGPISGWGFAVRAGDWIDVTGSTVVELPDTTLGLRCYPNRAAFVEVLSRESSLTAVEQP